MPNFGTRECGKGGACVSDPRKRHDHSTCTCRDMVRVTGTHLTYQDTYIHSYTYIYIYTYTPSFGIYGAPDTLEVWSHTLDAVYRFCSVLYTTYTMHISMCMCITKYTYISIYALPQPDWHVLFAFISPSSCIPYNFKYRYICFKMIDRFVRSYICTARCLDTTDVVNAFKHTKRRIFFLDYEGTLAPDRRKLHGVVGVVVKILGHSDRLGLLC